jgi:hypothetical protein
VDAKPLPRSPAGVDAWLLDQWSLASSKVARESGGAPEISAEAGPVYPASKLYAVADYIMRDTKGRISKRRAMETLQMIEGHQRASRSA